jgi:hypothetical protein
MLKSITMKTVRIVEPNYIAAGWAAIGIAILLSLALSIQRAEAPPPAPRWMVGDIVYIAPGGQQAQVNAVACIPGEEACIYNARLAADPAQVVDWLKEFELR